MNIPPPRLGPALWASLLALTAPLVATEFGQTQHLEGPDTVPQNLSASDWTSIRAAYEAERDASASTTADPIAQQAYLKASNTGADDLFGRSVSISGDTVVVGAPWEDSPSVGVNGNGSENGAEFSGAAYIFVRSGTTWIQQAFLKASNAEANDQFGSSVAVSGDTVVIGAPTESSSATGVNGNQGDNGADRSGAVYVFVRIGTTWTQQAYLKASNTDANDLFGISVAIDGDNAIVGADAEASNATGVNGNQSNDSADRAGAAYVFVRLGTTWLQRAYLKASNTDGGDGFGFSVALSGNTAIVGAVWEDSRALGVNHPGQSDNNAADSGAAYVFVRDGSTWTQQAYLKASNTGSGDEFGGSVAISGDTVVVGAQEDSNATGADGNQSDNSAINAGAAYVFVRNAAIWGQQAYLKASNTEADDFFGRSIAISGDILVIGAFGEDGSGRGVNGDQNDNSAAYSGAAYIFVRNGTDWEQTFYLKSSNAEAGDYFGNSVATSDGTIVVGAWFEWSQATGVSSGQDNNNAQAAGAAYIFSGLLPFTQQAYVKASNTGSNHSFGWSVAVSDDTVVVGAYGEDSNATGVDGNQDDSSAADSGAAYVFLRSGGTWIQQAYLKASNAEAGDEFGFSVSISSDTIIVGAIREDSASTGVNGDQSNNDTSSSGAAYVFVRSGSSWTQQAYLKMPSDGAEYYFGQACSVSGDTVVVGAPGGVGAFVFARSGTIWTENGALSALNSEAVDGYGASVAVSGGTIVVGAYTESSNATGVNGDETDNSAPYAGAAYIFVRDGLTWSQSAYLKASNSEAGDFFGWSVAIDGDTVVVGAYVEDSDFTGINHPTGQSDNSAANSGAAYVFVRSGAAWVQQAYLKASNTEADDWFGFAVGVSGDTVSVGAETEDSYVTGVNGDQGNNNAQNSGAVYVFRRSGITWAQEAYLKASNTGVDDFFGSSVAVSGDTVIAGARFEASRARGVNHPTGQSDNSLTSGAAYIFTSTERTALENWRLHYFGNSGDAGESADLADLDGDGMSNLLEFATAGNPRQAGALPVSSTQDFGFTDFTYTRNKAALFDVRFIVEWTDTLPALSWSTAGVSEAITNEEGSLQQVKAMVPLAPGNRQFIRLRATR